MTAVRFRPGHGSRSNSARSIAFFVAALTAAALATPCFAQDKGRSNYQDLTSPGMKVVPATPGIGETPSPGTGDTGTLVGALSLSGAELPGLSVPPQQASIISTVDLAGDQPLSTHVLVRSSGFPMLQRTGDGQWAQWDGNPDTLVDNGFAPVSGKLTYRVLSGDISGWMFPVNFVLAYRTAAGLKFGVFNVMPQ